MKINIYYGGRGLIDDPTLYVINKMEEVFRELRVTVERFQLCDLKNSITTLPQTLKDADGIILATTVEWNRPSSAVVANVLTAPGVRPSTTIRFGLSLVGGQEEPGQCHTNVFKPASALTFHIGSALQYLESRLYIVSSKSLPLRLKQVIPWVQG